MSAELTHDQAADEIEAVALGIAPEEIALGVIAHAGRCAECAAELRSFHHVIASLASLIPKRQLNRGHSAQIKSRLLARTGVGQDAGAARRPPRAEPARPELRAPRAPLATRPEIEPGRDSRDRPDRSSLPVWIAVVATLIAAGSIAALLNARSGRDAFVADAGVGETDLASARIAELERLVAEKDTLIGSLAGPNVRIIGLFNREAREPLARMFWDRRADRWTLFVYSLRQPRPGRTFYVWLGTDRGRVPLGTFAPTTDGRAMFSAVYPLALAALNTVLISEEAAGSSARAPTGPVVLAGALR